jgi:hypothetical protein
MKSPTVEHNQNSQFIPDPVELEEIRNLFPELNTPREMTQSQFYTTQQSVMTLTKDSIGKVRQGQSTRLSGNRPMSSPGGFRLYGR